MRILLGEKAPQYLVEVLSLPEVGDELILTQENSKSADSTFTADFGSGIRVRITRQKDLARETPWFYFEII